MAHIGKHMSHYTILEKLGEGGMGVVYKAEDTKLKRIVALKFLSPDVIEKTGSKERFLDEARAAASLNHPNICTIYEINEINDQYYLSMEYIEGQTLERLIKSDEQPLDVILTCAEQIAAGLNSAHKRGFIHGDIKPGNIMLTDLNRPKIVDFGLARLAEQIVSAESHMTTGTVLYQAPEKTMSAEGDERSDIWSLGVVMYEMTTGHYPFKGESEQAIAYSIVNENPDSITEMRDGIPMGMERIVNTSLAKRPEDRYQSMSDLLFDLQRIRKDFSRREDIEQFIRKNVPSIAVLPFVNMSADQEQEYFCDGLSEEIINGLTSVENLFVVARTSAFAFKNTNTDIRKIARDLCVDNIMEGSVRKSGENLRITANLIKVESGAHLWSEKFDRKVEGIFEIQDEISLAIIDKLKVKLMGSEKKALTKRRTDNLDAYSLYLKGRFCSESMTRGGFLKSLECFEKALAKDSNYAQVYTGMGAALVYNSMFGNMSPRIVIPQIRAYTAKALSIDDTMGEAHCMAAICRMIYDWDWREAEKDLKVALRLSPNSAMIHLYHSVYYTLIEKHDMAVAAARKARELDPLSDFSNFIRGQALYIAGRYDESLKDLKVSLNMNQNYYPLHFTMGYNYRKMGMLDKAMESFEKAYALSGKVPWTQCLLCIELYEAGKEERAREMLDDLEDRSGREYIPPTILYLANRHLGELKKAAACLKNAYHEHDSFLCWFKVSPIDLYRIPPDSRLFKKHL